MLRNSRVKPGAIEIYKILIIHDFVYMKLRFHGSSVGILGVITSVFNIVNECISL